MSDEHDDGRSPSPDEIIRPLIGGLGEFQKQLVDAIKSRANAHHRLTILTENGRFKSLQIVRDKVEKFDAADSTP